MWIHMARKKLHREPVLKDWSEVNDALRSIHEYEHALTEMGVDMSRRIDAVKAEYTKSRCRSVSNSWKRTFRSMWRRTGKIWPGKAAS